MYRSMTLGMPFLTLGMLAPVSAEGIAGAELIYFGRASVKIKTVSGVVIYIDPYAPGDYSEPADLILVTHGHLDHNQIELVTRKSSTLVVAAPGSVREEGSRIMAEGDSLTVGSVLVRAMPAANKNHKRDETVGFLVSFDGIVVYHAGDSDYLPEMANWGDLGISYALLPCDGFYNMGPQEATRCAQSMKARRVIPIHSSPTENYGEQNAKAVLYPVTIVLRPGERVRLEP